MSHMLIKVTVFRFLRPVYTAVILAYYSLFFKLMCCRKKMQAKDRSDSDKGQVVNAEQLHHCISKTFEVF